MYGGDTIYVLASVAGVYGNIVGKSPNYRKSNYFE